MLIALRILPDPSDVPDTLMTSTSAIAAGIMRPAATGEMGVDAGPKTTDPAPTKSVSIKKWPPCTLKMNSIASMTAMMMSTDRMNNPATLSSGFNDWITRMAPINIQMSAALSAMVLLSGFALPIRVIPKRAVTIPRKAIAAAMRPDNAVNRVRRGSPGAGPMGENNRRCGESESVGMGSVLFGMAAAELAVVN